MKVIDWHAQGLIPLLLYFQNGTVYTGSVTEEGNKEFRYKISPKDDMIFAEAWYGHSMDADGREEMIDWLKSKYEDMIE